MARRGLGTATQLRIEMLKYRAGIDILHVPYRGSADALNDLLPNNIQMMNEINVLPHVKAGKLILLNVNFSQRHPDFPDVPTLTELGYPDFDVPIWFFILRAGRHAEGHHRQAQRQDDRDRQVATEMIAKLRAINVVAPPQTPEEIRAYLAEDSKRNADLIKAANIKLEGAGPDDSPVNVGHQERAVDFRRADGRDREIRLLHGEQHVLIQDRIAAAPDEAHIDEIALVGQQQSDRNLGERSAGRHRLPQGAYDAAPEVIVLS